MFLRLFFFVLLPFFLTLSCGGGDSDEPTQCETICSHLYDNGDGDCDTSYGFVGSEPLTEDECVDDCATFSSSMADCLEDVACTSTALDTCFAIDSGGGGTTTECVTDSECGSGEECSSGTCVTATSNLCGGEVCSAGCCEGSVCCGGAFCGGDCIGTPCC